MPGLEPFEDDAGSTVFRDVIMLALVGFVAMVILILPHLNPPGAEAIADAAPPGNVIVEIRWPDEMSTSGCRHRATSRSAYSNKGGAVFNLLRDDLGRRADITGLNYETAYSRGIPAGEYTVNVHLYRNPSGVVPVPVNVVTSVKRDPNASVRQLLASEVMLTREGEELTVYRFRLTEGGDLVPGSVHSLQKELRARRLS